MGCLQLSLLIFIVAVLWYFKQKIQSEFFVNNLFIRLYVLLTTKNDRKENSDTGKKERTSNKLLFLIHSLFKHSFLLENGTVITCISSPF